jgi:hypothetical protein
VGDRGLRVEIATGVGLVDALARVRDLDAELRRRRRARRPDSKRERERERNYNWFQNWASSSGCDGWCVARTQGAFVSAAIRARLRTPPRAVQRGPTAQRLILKPVLPLISRRITFISQTNVPPKGSWLY